MERSAADLAKLDEILTACPEVTMICLDVANGYSEAFVEVVKQVADSHSLRTALAVNCVKVRAGATEVPYSHYHCWQRRDQRDDRGTHHAWRRYREGLPTNALGGPRHKKLTALRERRWASALAQCAPHASKLALDTLSSPRSSSISAYSPHVEHYDIPTPFHCFCLGCTRFPSMLRCADAAHGLGGHVMGDGGITCPGDGAKAFCAGSDFIMCGGMFAGTSEAAGEVVERDGQKFKMFYGMSSSTAMSKHSGGVANYRSSEGKTVEVPFRGPVSATVQDFFGGIRSACTYIGASSIKEMPKRATFIRVTQQLNQIFGNHDLSKK